VERTLPSASSGQALSAAFDFDFSLRFVIPTGARPASESKPFVIPTGARPASESKPFVIPTGARSVSDGAAEEPAFLSSQIVRVERTLPSASSGQALSAALTLILPLILTVLLTLILPLPLFLTALSME
jgi:hypothetical protein